MLSFRGFASLLRALLTLVILIAIAAVVIALWGSHGHLLAVVEGQLDRGPTLTDTDVSAHPPLDAPPVAIQVSVDTSTSLRTVDPRYLSFAIDTSAVVGGKWWDPKAEDTEMGSGTVHAPVFDFDRPRLDTLTRALAPAFLRIGGSEADKVHYDMKARGERPPAPPPGYESVLTARQWDAVNAFARRNGLDLVMTLNAGPAARQATGQWRAENAQALIAYSYDKGYQIAHWELGNELNLYWFVHGVVQQVAVEQYAEDLARLRQVISPYYPSAKVSGQSAAFWPVLGEPLGVLFGFQSKYARLVGGNTDMFGWHYYPQQSRRGPVASRRANPGRLLDPDNLDEVAHWAQHNATLRDAYSPGRPLWLGETGNAQFGGEPGLSDRYLASLWWLDQLGLLAVHHHDVVVRQTLCGLNYQLITDDALEPLPDYWASLLWKRLMGRQVLSTTVTGSRKARAYAHVSPDGRSISVLLINLHHDRPLVVRGIPVSNATKVYAVTAKDLFGTEALLNGEPLAMINDATLPELRPAAPTKTLTVHPLSYTFVNSPR